MVLLGFEIRIFEEELELLSHKLGEEPLVT